ncbi:uncharacterized protein LOC110879809 [Helianthus annuus]|nr:uncharacterized protein LOC110879809 [Helianthus annuus]
MNSTSGDTMHSSSSVTTVSPSFTAHSSTSNNLADVAARVVEEFRLENGDEYDDIFNSNDHSFGYDNTEFSVTADVNADAVINPDKTKDNNTHDSVHDDDEDDFEFAVVCNDVNSSSISTNEIFYPLFDRSLLLDVDPDQTNAVNSTAETDCKPLGPLRLPLSKLFSEDRDFGSSSSSEADELDGITPGTYCVWKPKKPQSPERCKKSNSTGNSSRRWKFRDILYRSNSESKESPFLFFKPSIATNSKKISSDKLKKIEKREKEAATDGAPAVTPEKHDRRQSYLPSGEALATAFTTVSRSNRTLHIF